MDQTFRRMPCGDETLSSSTEARPLPETGSTELSGPLPKCPGISAGSFGNQIQRGAACQAPTPHRTT